MVLNCNINFKVVIRDFLAFREFVLHFLKRLPRKVYRQEKTDVCSVLLGYTRPVLVGLQLFQYISSNSQ